MVAEAVTEPLVGAIVDTRYELRRLIARGGMGLVFEAHHRFTRRMVALKLLHDSHRALKEARGRLLREAHALTAVRHPGFVEVLDAGVCAERGPYVVLEMLEGRTLDGILASRRRLSIAETVAIGAQVCDAIAHAHGRGVVHRDIKPSNVFVARSEVGQERITILDLGVAAVAEERLEHLDSKLTTAHEVLGTPEYMAPEQLWGRSVDARTDVYAIGMTLYECLTGEVPYAGAYPDVVVKVSNASLPPSVRERRPEVPATLAMVIEHALEKDPAARFQSAAELSRALVAASSPSKAPLALLSTSSEDVPESGELESPRAALDGDEQAIKLVRRKSPRGPDAAPPSAASPLSRRNVARAPYVTPVVLTPKGSHGQHGQRIEARTEEISEDGVLVLSPVAFPLGLHLDLRFAGPVTGELVLVTGSIRWIREGRGRSALGVEFEKLPAILRQVVRDYVAAHQKTVDAAAR